MGREGQKLVEYRILGPLSVRAGGRELTLGGRKQRRVLALLLLHANRAVKVDHLAAAVWAVGTTLVASSLCALLSPGAGPR